jgi:signal transduction histidine kinase
MLTVISGWAQFWEEKEGFTPDDHLPARYLHIGVGRIRYLLDRFAFRAGKTSTDVIGKAWNTMADMRSNSLAEVNVNRLVETTLAALDPRIGAGYVLGTSLEPDPWPVIADFGALDIVLVNLLMDAATASIPGTSITIDTTNVETHEPLVGIGGTLAPGRYVAISVRNSADNVSREVFENPQDLTMNGRCPQRGLPICLGILHEHAGLLQVAHSTTGETTSVVFLPTFCSRQEMTPKSIHPVKTEVECCQ